MMTCEEHDRFAADRGLKRMQFESNRHLRRRIIATYRIGPAKRPSLLDVIDSVIFNVRTRLARWWL